MDTDAMEQGIQPESAGRITAVEAWAKSLKIVTADQYEKAVSAVKAIKGLRSDIVAFFSEGKAAAYKAWKAICSQEASFTDRLDSAERVAKAEMIRYQQAEEAKRIAEQRRLQAEADEKARKNREAAEKAAAKLKTPELREERMAQAAAITAPVVDVAQVAPKVAGVAMKKVWKARVVDVALVPREYMTVNQSALDAVARSTKGAVKIPGVEMFEEAQLAVGR